MKPIKPIHSLTFSSGRNPSGVLSLASVIPSTSNRREVKILNGLSGIFRPAAEVFITNIMVVDVFALWLPRVLGALFRGANEGKPVNDSRSLFSYMKGLNWANAWEETWREVCSGPALFFWPTLIFSFARKKFGGRSIEIKQPLLESTTQKLIENLPTTGSDSARLKQGWDRFLISIFKDIENTSPLETKFIKEWTSKLTNVLNIKHTFPQQRKYEEALSKLHEQLTTKVIEYNRKNFSKPRFYQYDSTLTLLGKTSSLMQTNKLFSTLVNFYDLIRHIKKNNNSSTESLEKSIWHTYQNVVKAKAVYSILSIGVTLAFLSKLVFWSQKNNNYPANRHIPFDLNPLSEKVSSVFTKTTDKLLLPNFKEWAR